MDIYWWSGDKSFEGPTYKLCKVKQNFCWLERGIAPFNSAPFFFFLACVRTCEYIEWGKLCHRANAFFPIDCPPGHITESCNTTFRVYLFGERRGRKRGGK